MHLLRTIVQILAAGSLVLAAIEIYLTVNKIWKRKHEAAVVDSVSIAGEFVGLVPLFFLTLNFVLERHWTAAVDTMLWMLASFVMITIGAGLWVEGRRGRNFSDLLRDAMRPAIVDVVSLVKPSFMPAAASKIVKILGRLALIDHELDDREAAFIQTFAKAWGVSFSPEALGVDGGNRNAAFAALRNDVAEYLSTLPPHSQVRHLAEAVRALVRVDGSVTEEETVMLGELEGMWGAYLDGATSAPDFVVALVPQRLEQDRAIASVLPGVRRMAIQGGEAYVAGRFHSERYAEIVGRDYRALNIFTTVIRLDPSAHTTPTA